MAGETNNAFTRASVTTCKRWSSLKYIESGTTTYPAIKSANRTNTCGVLLCPQIPTNDPDGKPFAIMALTMVRK